MSKILIVGGAGYIGGSLTDILYDTSYEYIVYDSLVYEESYLKPVKFQYGDIRNINVLFPLIEWADTIVWLAALVGDGACAVNPLLSKELNQDSLSSLTKYLNEIGDKSKKVIYMSTCSVYGAQNGILDEQSQIKPLSVYGTTKYGGEKILVENWENTLVYRLGTVFGIGDLYSRIRLDLVVNVLTMKAATENKLTVFGGEQFRPLIHVKDVSNMILKHLDSTITGVYNLCSQNVRIIDLAYQIRNHFPDCTMEVTQIEFEDSRNYRVTSDKAYSDLSFETIYTIDYGILQIKELIKQKRIKNLNNPKYSNQLFLQEMLI